MNTTLTIGAGGHIFILQSGGLGDLVLLEPLISSLSAAHPFAAITVACRREYAAILALFPRPPREVIPLEVRADAEIVPTANLYTRLNELDALLGHRFVELFISADRNPNWLSWYLGAKVRPRQALASPGWQEMPRGLVRALLGQFELPEVTFSGPAVAASAHEKDRLAGLAREAGAIPGDRNLGCCLPAMRRLPRSGCENLA
jgi:hypothetical protein